MEKLINHLVSNLAFMYASLHLFEAGFYFINTHKNTLKYFSVEYFSLEKAPGTPESGLLVSKGSL